jgi:hypothetical protein
VEPNDKNKWLSLAGSINAVDNVFEPIDKLWGKRINQWLKINHWITFWSSKSRHHIFRFHVYNVYTHQTSFNYSSMCITYAHISHCFSRTVSIVVCPFVLFRFLVGFVLLDV